MPYYTHTHFINIDFLWNHTPTEFHFSCDSLQSVFSAYNSSVITLQMLTLDLCQSAGTVRKPTVLKRPWPQKHERGEGGVNMCEWEICRPRERGQSDWRRQAEKEWQNRAGGPCRSLRGQLGIPAGEDCCSLPVISPGRCSAKWDCPAD